MKHSASAKWTGNLKEGAGTVSSQSGALSNLGYSFKSRFVDETGKSGTNPEELIAAFLAENGTPGEVNVSAVVEIIPGTGITGSALTVEGKVPGIDAAKFEELAQKAKAECPVSKALGAINVTMTAKLV